MKPLFELDHNAVDREQIENILNLIEAYEDKHYPIPQPNAVHRILYHWESRRVLCQ